MPDYSEPPSLQHLRFWQGKLFDPQFVYVIQAGRHGPIKIGFARDPLHRLSELQTGNPVRLELLLVIPGMRSLEAKLQRRIESSRLLGEWYEWSQEFVAEMRKIAWDLVETYDGNGEMPSVFLDDEEPVVAPIPAGARAAAWRETTHKLGHRWRMSQPEKTPVTVRFVDPKTLS